MELGFATERLSRPQSARQAAFAEPEPGLGRQAWCNSFKHTQPSSAGLPPSPTSDIKPSHVFHSARSARQRGKKKKKKCPPFFSLGWQHPLLRAVNLGGFQRPTWSAETHSHRHARIWRNKSISLPSCYTSCIQPAYLQVLKFNSLQLG